MSEKISLDSSELRYKKIFEKERNSISYSALFQYYYIIKSKSMENKHDFSLPVSWNGIFYASGQSAAKP